MTRAGGGTNIERKRWWILALTLAATVALLGVALAQGTLRGAPAGGGYGPGMMAGGAPTPGYPGGGYGGMPAYGGGMMGGGWRMGGGMMGGYERMGGGMGGAGMMQVLPSTATPLDDDAVKAALQRGADAVTPGARLHDIMVFTNNVYAQVLDADGHAVGEILLDRYDGAVSPEPGPNMMWNTRWGMGAYGTGAYGRMGAHGPGMAPGGWTRPNGTSGNAGGAVAFDEAAAKDRANAFLAGYLPGASVLGAQAFPGYYTFDYGTGAKPQGMLSVNAATGQVWPHTWHGAFIREME